MGNRLDTIEREQLQDAVRQIEIAIALGTVPGDGVSSGLLTRFIENAKKRIEQLEIGEESFEADKRQRERQELTIALLVQRETALTSAEREQFGSFLQSDYFTRSDFGALEKFYASAWDRLTEEGRALMSNRIWEGVRREEYDFSELPEIVKQKEAQRLYDLLLKGIERDAGLARIPESDRRDFISAWNAGRKEDVYQILNRSSFRDNVAVAEKTGHAIADGRTQHSGQRSEITAAEGLLSKEESRAPTGGLGALKLDREILGSLQNVSNEAPEVPIAASTAQPEGKAR